MVNSTNLNSFSQYRLT